MKAGVLTPTLGESKWLDETIASVSSLPGQNRHVLIAPEGQARALARCYPMLTVLADEGRGLYAALNRGFSAMGDCDLLTWLNDDDLFDEEGARRIVESMRREQASDVVYGRVRMMSARGRDAGEIPVAREPAHLKSLLTRGIIPLAQPGSWFRRKLFEQLDGFDESYRLAGDLDFFVRALVAEARFRFLDYTVAHFRLRPGQLSQDEQAGEREKIAALRHLPPAANPSFLIALLFRLQNRRAYLYRLRRFGPVRMQEVYRRASKR